MGDHGMLGIHKKHVIRDTNPRDSRVRVTEYKFPGETLQFVESEIGPGYKVLGVLKSIWNFRSLF